MRIRTMFVQHSTRYKDVPSWGLSDSFWERIKPFIPGLLEVVWVILGVERVEYTHYCRLLCIPRGR